MIYPLAVACGVLMIGIGVTGILAVALVPLYLHYDKRKHYP